MYQLWKPVNFYIYLKFWGSVAAERGSVVVGETSLQAKGPGSILGWKFLFFNKKDSLYQLKNFLSVLKMASLVYERENCADEG